MKNKVFSSQFFSRYIDILDSDSNIRHRGCLGFSPSSLGNSDTSDYNNYGVSKEALDSLWGSAEQPSMKMNPCEYAFVICNKDGYISEVIISICYSLG